MRIHSTVRSTLLLTLALATAPQIALPVVAEAQPASKPDSGSLGPIVTIVSPEYSDVIKGETQISVAIQPRRYPAQSVELLVDGRSVSGVLAVQTKFNWKTNLFVDGPHTLTVRVTDTQGFIGQAETTVFINNDARVDDASPILRWLGVQQGQKLSGVAKVRLEAADNFGVKYVFLNLNTAIAPDVKPPVASWMTNRPPYEFPIDTTKYEDGLYVLDAYAWDEMENERNAPRLTVRFSNSPEAQKAPETVKELEPTDDTNETNSRNLTGDVADPVVQDSSLIPPRLPVSSPRTSMFSAPRNSAISSQPTNSVEKLAESAHQPTYVTTAKLSHPTAQPRQVESASPAAETATPRVPSPASASSDTKIAARPDTASGGDTAPYSTTIAQIVRSTVSKPSDITPISAQRQDLTRLSLNTLPQANPRSLAMQSSTPGAATAVETSPTRVAPSSAVSVSPEVTVAGQREVFSGSATVSAGAELPRVASATGARSTSPELSARVLPDVVLRPQQPVGFGAATIAPASTPASATSARASAAASDERIVPFRSSFQATTPTAAAREAAPTVNPRIAKQPADVVFAPRVSSGAPSESAPKLPAPAAGAPTVLAARPPASVREPQKNLTSARVSVTPTGSHQTRITGAVYQSPLRTTSTSVLPTLPRVAFSPTVRSTPKAVEGAAIVVAPSTGAQPQHIAVRDETLAAIAAHYKMPVTAIAAANKLPENARVQKGTRVLLPQALMLSYKGQAVTGDVAPLLIGSTSVAPFRFLFEKQGGTMSYDASNQRVTARNNNYEVTLEIGSDKAVVNEEEVLMDMAAFLLSGRTMVPVRFFEKALKAKVEWEPSTGRIFVAMTQ